MYNIIYSSRWGNEIVDTADNKKEAEYLRKEYMLAFNSFNIEVKLNK